MTIWHMSIPVCPWSDAVAHYRRDEDGEAYEGLEPMLDLVQRIADSPYSRGLVAYISHWDLIVAQAAANFSVGPDLRIEFDHYESRKFTFTYRETLFAKNPWTRTAEADEGFEVLERFLLKRARWFRKPVGA